MLPEEIAAMKVGMLVQLAARYYPAVGEKYAQGKQCGTLAILGPAGVQYPLTMKLFFGTPPEEGTGSYEYAMEKCSRLKENTEHLSSYQSRNPDLKRWGGAIRLKNPVIGFIAWSGYPEPVDEAFMLYCAVASALMTLGEAGEVAYLSNNSFFEHMLKEF